MIIIPAIDLMRGQAVRLAQGERERVTVYSSDPAGLAAAFARAGAKLLHVVDLDGAFDGQSSQRDAILAIAKTASKQGMHVQTGGGVRSVAAAAALLEAGIERVVVGTLAVREPTAVERLCAQYPNRVVIAADARNGKVAVEGWTEASQLDARELAHRAQNWGAVAILHTDVHRDGMQGGPAVEATAALQREVSIPVYASGGVGTLSHLDVCRDAGIAGVVVGRALYEEAFTIEEALSRC